VTAQLAEVDDDDPWSARCYGSILVDPLGFMGINPGMGRANPIAPVMTMDVHEGAVDGTVRFDLQHVGPPYRAHGGVVASVFDQVLGTAAIAGRQAGMTAEMTVRYKRATPLHEEVRYEARFTHTDAGMSHTTGELYDSEGRITAEAEATFYLPREAPSE
jgi:acyl-coenzyme A thioesterase PaaI-like protein